MFIIGIKNLFIDAVKNSYSKTYNCTEEESFSKSQL